MPRRAYLTPPSTINEASSARKIPKREPTRITASLALFISSFVHATWHGQASGHASPEFIGYTTQVLRTTALPFPCILVSLLLICRLKRQKPRLSGGPGSECRVLVCSLITSMKTAMDSTYTNKTWAEVCGIPIEEIAQMEMEFLTQLDWNTHVRHEEYHRWLHYVESAVKRFACQSMPPPGLQPVGQRHLPHQASRLPSPVDEKDGLPVQAST